MRSLCSLFSSSRLASGFSSGKGEGDGPLERAEEEGDGAREGLLDDVEEVGLGARSRFLEEDPSFLIDTVEIESGV